MLSDCMLREFGGLRRLQLLIALAAACGLLGLPAAFAQSFPNKPIHFVVPFSAGGGNDVLARELGQNISVPLGVPVVIDNKAGGSTIIGTEYAARAAPDGYTIFMGNNSALTINPNLFKLPFDAVKDFAPVSLLARAPFILLVNPSVPARSVKELIALAKVRPGQLNFGSGGIGIVTHLAGEMLKSMAHIDMVHVPYSGTDRMFADLLGGHIDIVFNSMLSSIPHVRSGRLRGLAVTSAKRSEVMPELPTVAESAPGLSAYEVTVWYAVLAPARTPQDVVMRLNAEFVKALRDPKVSSRLKADGATPIGSAPEELAQVIRTDIAKWAVVVRDAKLHLEMPKS